MGSLGRQLHIFFFPFLAHGHMIPSVDMAKLFASRGVKTTIITTPLNAPFFSKTIQKTKDSGFDIDIQTIEFPAAEAGLPEGCENTDAFITNEMTKKLIVATTLLQEPFEKVLQERHPDCIVADMFFPWATDAAAKFGIPRLVFHGISNFALCAGECVRLYEPHKQVSSDSEPFVVPNLPGDIIKLTRKQLPASVREDVENDFTKLVKASKESELRSFGVVVNSFYELEPAYADHYRKVLGRRAWNLLYICFGSLTNFTASQLKEIATGLEASGLQFIWVVRRNKNSKEDKEDKEDWLPEGFEERMEGKGLIIRGWAPQVLILDHEATGAFVTHCGWNSTLEGITAGKPMITWPLFGEQFYNEKLVIDVLRTGVAVGAKEWAGMHGDHVTLKSEAIEKAITRIMVGVEADERRSRARKLGETARKAVEKGGSSFSDVNSLIEELRRHRP
ncbi:GLYCOSYLTRANSFERASE [Salix purpurea]|uniref:Glycosyltransferase n=1 Tax=Salix purpurea TaxID=77065 RepID=A0A9Q0QET1_SALPP|nr:GLYCOSYLTRANSFERASE [Salix purpurea]